MSHVMIDIETLGTRPTSVIWQIGAVQFDLHGPTQRPYLDVVVDPQSCMNNGGTVDWDTLRWWMDDAQKMARDQLLSCPTTSLWNALKLLREWWPAGTTSVWANGVSFDIVILENAFRSQGIEPPWGFRDIEDMRTLRKRFPNIPRIEPSVPHVAVRDAEAQAAWVASVLRFIA